VSFTTDFLTGVAQQLHDAGIGTYRPDTPYLAGETAIVFKDMPTAPNRAIVLNTYSPGADDNPHVPVSLIALQVRIRGNPGQPLDPDGTRDQVYNLLHGQEHRTYGTCHANQILHQSTIPNGKDDSKRWEVSINFYADVDLPPTLNRPAP
jgi:hypothetical protein